MPVRVIWEKDHYILEFSGHLVIRETIEAYGQLVGNEKFDACDFGIVDCRTMKTVSYTDIDYRKHASFAKAASLVREGLRVAVVVSHGETEKVVRKFMASVQASFEHSWERKVFYGIDEALAWARPAS